MLPREVEESEMLNAFRRRRQRLQAEAIRLSQRTAPGAMARALDDDARKRGLR